MRTICDELTAVMNIIRLVMITKRIGNPYLINVKSIKQWPEYLDDLDHLISLYDECGCSAWYEESFGDETAVYSHTAVEEMSDDTV